jgi:DNA-binding CsgD family transcriptional regulator
MMDGRPYVFISYASADRERVLPLVDALTRAGVGVWIDREGIHGGANYGREIAEAIKDAAALVLMASSLSLASRNVKQEIAVGWEYERPYLPLLLEPVIIPDDLKYWLTAAQWVEVLDKPESDWLPAVLTALVPLGIAPKTVAHDAMRLAGRERELAMLRERLAAAQEGRGGLMLIGGEAGVGKTALAEWLLHHAARHGTVTLVGRCYDLTETPPYGPWVELFGRYRPASGAPAPPTTLVPGESAGEFDPRAVLFQQVSDFCSALAALRPVVLLLDDMQWSDTASLDLLRFLARVITTLPVLILVTYRSDDLTRRHPLYPLLPLLVREAGAERLDVRALDEAGVCALVTDRYGLDDASTARLATYLQARAEGNAFFIGELLRSLEEMGGLRRAGDAWRLGDVARVAIPPLLRQVIDGRLARLSEESQRLLDLAAVIGQEVPLDVWASVTEMTEEDLLPVMEEATAAHLLEPTTDGLGVRFAHALVREALYEGILPVRRRQYHRRIAEALAARPHPDPDAVAFHFEQARDERAVAWMVAAGDRAERLYAYLIATDRLERALTLLDEHGDDQLRGWLLVRLGILYRRRDHRRALAYLDAAEPCVRAAEDPVLTAYARASRGLVRCIAGQARSGLADLKAGVAAIRQLPDRTRAAEALPTSIRMALEADAESTYVFWLGSAGHFAEARTYGEALLATDFVAAETGGKGALPRGDAYIGLTGAYTALGMPERAVAAAVQAREEYRRIGNYSLALGTSRFLVSFVLLRYDTDRPALRRAAIAEAGGDWPRVASSGIYSPAVTALGSLFLHPGVELLEGNWKEAQHAAAVLRDNDTGSIGVTNMLPALGAIACAQGEWEMGWHYLRQLMPEGLDAEPGDSNIFDHEAGQRVAADLALTADDYAVAKQWLEAHDRLLAWSGAAYGQSEGQALWAKYYRRTDETTKAYEYAERALAHAIEPCQPLALLQAHRLLGELDTEAGRYDGAAHHLDESLRLANACAAPYERALTLLALAEQRSAQRDNDAARTLLDEVRAICEPLGAKPALARAAALATRLDAVPTTVPSYPSGLSAREVEVLRLVAQGLTNPQVGERLFLSPRTVEQHLHSIFNKTGVSSRVAAARWAAEHSLV